MEIDKLASLEGWTWGSRKRRSNGPDALPDHSLQAGQGPAGLLLAVVLYFQPATQLPTDYEKLMGAAVKEVFHYLRIHPENKFLCTWPNK